jgi:hypothetical protein
MGEKPHYATVPLLLRKKALKKAKNAAAIGGLSIKNKFISHPVGTDYIIIYNYVHLCLLHKILYYMVCHVSLTTFP